MREEDILIIIIYTYSTNSKFRNPKETKQVRTFEHQKYSFSDVQKNEFH